NLFYCLLGVTMGTLVGVLPGLGPSATIALLLPTTYHMDPVPSLIMLAGISYGSMYGGSTTSILLNIPGEPSSLLTCLDGYQMARQGRAGPALGVSAVGSFVAGTFSVMGLAFIAPTLARMALGLGPPEYFSLMVMGLTIVSYLARVSMVKAWMMTALGLIISTVGMDPITGQARFVFGVRSLYDGLTLPAIMMGLFGVSEVLENIGKYVKPEIYKGKITNFFGNREDWRQSAKPIARGTLLGFFMGVFPGIGSVVPTLISYVIEKRLSKHPEKFGKGAIEGLAAVEACNNAAVGGTYVPLLSLGIPSSGMTALLLAALMIYGLNPGPLLIRESPRLFWAVVASMYVGNVMLLVLNLPLIPLWVKVLKIPYSYLSAMILLFCLIGAYSLNNSPSDVIVMILFGTLGYILREFRFELPPLVLAFVLGPMLEPAFRTSLIISKGSLGIFVTRPISALFLLVAFIVLVSPLATKKRLGAGLQQED
ncbi:MAG: tripartite tricarboxylate transporter permease, partial [Deltaproteobacteria bacterium]|nr:tripartite tricarboxylate transporter permease [Deltaproteobacteria bacterium]